MAVHNRIVYPVQDIRNWIQEGKTQAWIAAVLREQLDARITAKLIYKVCKRERIQCQRTGPRSGPGHPEWKGGLKTGKHGYIEAYCPDHPDCVKANSKRAAKSNGEYFRKKTHVWRHRLVMEKHLGRFLKPNEVVHHKDGNRQNNAIENLELFDSNGAHLKTTLAGKCPNWTPQGQARMKEVVARIANRKFGASLLKLARGEPLSRSTLARLKARLSGTAKLPC